MAQIRTLLICKSCINGLSESSPAKKQNEESFLQKVREELKATPSEEWKVEFTGCLDLCPEEKIGCLIRRGENDSPDIEFTSEFQNFKDFAGQCQRSLKLS